MAKGRVTLNVELPATSQGRLRDYCERKGKIQRHLLGQLIEWFVSQPGAVRRVIEDGSDMDPAERVAYSAILDGMVTRLRGLPATHDGKTVKPGAVIGLNDAEEASPPARPSAR